MRTSDFASNRRVAVKFPRQSVDQIGRAGPGQHLPGVRLDLQVRRVIQRRHRGQRLGQRGPGRRQRPQPLGVHRHVEMDPPRRRARLKSGPGSVEQLLAQVHRPRRPPVRQPGEGLVQVARLDVTAQGRAALRRFPPGRRAAGRN